jgi:hypothetical protein
MEPGEKASLVHFILYNVSIPLATINNPRLLIHTCLNKVVFFHYSQTENIFKFLISFFLI